MNSKPAPQPALPRCAGFTLTELLTVIAILIIVVAIGVPAFNQFIASGREEAAVTTATAAVAAARSYATRDIQFVDDDLDGNPNNGLHGAEGYSGAAALFTPDWKIRYVENVERARDGSDNFLELHDGEPNSISGGPYNGYEDIDGLEYLELPRGAAVVGVARNNNGLVLYPPPFAIRFNSDGVLIPAQPSGSPQRAVHYDGDYNSEYVTSRTRSNPYGSSRYNPEEWDPTSNNYAGDFEPDTNSNSPDPHARADKRKLPFERIEAVVGVIVFDYGAFNQAGHRLIWPELTASGNHGGADEEEAYDWILDNGTPLMFNRYTGVTMSQP